MVFPIENGKSEHDHRILHIRIILGTKLQLKLANFIFWTKFSQNQYFRSKTEKVDITIEFCIFEVVLELNFRLNGQFWFFCTKFVLKGYFRLKTEEMNITIEYCIHEFVQVSNFSLTYNFKCFGTNFFNICILYIWYRLHELHEQQNKLFYRKSENFENITFLPIIYKSVAKNPKTLSESKKKKKKKMSGGKRQFQYVLLQ